MTNLAPFSLATLAISSIYIFGYLFPVRSWLGQEAKQSLEVVRAHVEIIMDVER
jgi:hypothetical protein